MAKLEMKKLSKEEMDRAMALLEKDIERKEKIKRGEIKTGKKWSEMTVEEKNKFKAASARRNMKIRLTVEKALAAGITVTDKEIDAALAAKAKS